MDAVVVDSWSSWMVVVVEAYFGAVGSANGGRLRKLGVAMAYFWEVGQHNWSFEVISYSLVEIQIIVS